MFSFLHKGIHDKAFRLILRDSEQLTKQLCPSLTNNPERNEYLIESLLLFYSCCLRSFAANNVTNEVGHKLYFLIEKRFDDKIKAKLKLEGFTYLDEFIQKRNKFYFEQVAKLYKYEPVFMDANPQSPVIEMCYFLTRRPLTKESASEIVFSGRPKAALYVNMHLLAQSALPFYKIMDKLLPQFTKDIDSLL